MWTLSVTFFALLVLILGVFTGPVESATARYHPHGIYGLSVLNLVANPKTTGIVFPGQAVNFYGNVTGGLLYNGTVCQAPPAGAGSNSSLCENGIPGMPLTVPGYHLYWFFGQTNGTGKNQNSSAVQQYLPGPVACTPPNTPGACTGYTTAFQAKFTYDRIGTYVVSLTVYDGDFDYVVDKTEVTVAPPTFSVRINSHNSTATPDGIQIPTEGVDVMFNGSCLGDCANVALQWNYGDGSSDEGPITYHAYLASGIYAVTLTGVNLVTGLENRSFSYINVSDVPPGSQIANGVSSLLGPIPTIYAPTPGFFTPLNGTYNSTTGLPIDFCTMSLDLNPFQASNITFRWSFGDNTTEYSFPMSSTASITKATSESSSTKCGISNIPFLPPGGSYPGAPGTPLTPEFTAISHVYTAAGLYNVSVEAIDGEGAHSRSPRPLPVQVSNLPANVSVPATNVPVGQVAFLNASNGLGIYPITALYNFSWKGGPLGASYGDVARFSSFQPTSTNVTLTTTPNTNVLTGTKGTGTNLSTSVVFSRTRMTASVQGLYTVATLSVNVQNPAFYSALGVSLVENGRVVSSYRMAFPSASASFGPFQFSMANNWQVQLNYTPSGATGGTAVDVALNFKDHGTSVDNYSTTEPAGTPYAASQWFSDSAGNGQTHAFSVNAMALGEPIFGRLVFFTPGQYNVITAWRLGNGALQQVNTSGSNVDAPLEVSYPFETAYQYGKNYSLIATACPQGGIISFGSCASDRITVWSDTYLKVNDTAPEISIQNASGFSPTTIPGYNNSFRATVTAVDNVSGPTNVTWVYGDGSTSVNTSANASGATVIGRHAYRYGYDRYLIVAYARSPGGSVSVNWTFVKVDIPRPLVNFSYGPSSPIVGEPVHFDGSLTQNDVMGSMGLSYAWIFGDTHVAGGTGYPALFPTNNYSVATTYNATLFVENDEGCTSSTYHLITVYVNPIAAPFPYIAGPANVTADDYARFQVVIPPGSDLYEVPLVNVTWTWNDPQSTNVSYGLSAQHTFLLPGAYTVSARITAPNMGSYPMTFSLVVKDGEPILTMPYANTEIYGGIHPMTFMAHVLGDYADQGKAWNFTWSWGDGKPGQTQSPGGNLSFVNHTYNYSGPIDLAVSASGPYPTLGAPSATLTDSLLGLPDSSGAGVPDALAVMLHENPYLTSTWQDIKQNGTGCTNYVGQDCMVVPGIGTLTGDDNHDGLTNIQEIMGSVTGFYSNPLDPDPSGDGLSAPQHLFSESFSSQETVPYTEANGSSDPAMVAIPGVQYLGPARAFNKTALTVQLSSQGVIAAKLLLVAPGGERFPIGVPQGPMSNYTLLEEAPSWTGFSPYGLAVSDFAQGGTWYLELVDGSLGSSGTISAVTLTMSYYANPEIADPLHQGMLSGNGITVPVFNCSEPRNASFPVFSPANFSVYNQSIFPYTENYFKLSVLQGVPYVPGTNSSLMSGPNVNCSAAGVSETLGAAGATASYLGDADFGINAWNAHAAGDPLLTNGMKALGATNYDLTAGYYALKDGSVPDTSQDQALGGPYYSKPVVYPTDPISKSKYGGPLNPTALSTAGDGIPDSVAPDPIAPLGLEVSIQSATDGNCYVLANLVGGPQDIASVTLQTPSGQNEPTIYTPAQYGQSPGGCDNILGVNFGSNNYHFLYNDNYFFPMDNSLTSYSLTYNLWQNQTLTQTPPRVSENTPTCTFSNNSWCNVSGNIAAVAHVVPLQRLPVVLVNLSSEVKSIPGYGFRYVGEQRFYSFDLNMGSSPAAPFQSGTNVILESRTAFLNSSANLSLLNDPQDLANLSGCAPLSSAEITSANASSAGDMAIQLSVSGDISNSPACASSLLQEISPLNASGVVHGGEYLRLDSAQLELLGLDPGAITLAPFVAPSGFDSASGTPPVNVVSEVTSIVVSAINAIAGEIIAFTNFINDLPALLESYGQAILGALNSVVHAIESAASAILSAFEFIFHFIVGLFEKLMSWVVGEFAQIGKFLATTVALSLLSATYDAGYISLSQFNTSFANVTGGDPSPASGNVCTTGFEDSNDVLLGLGLTILAVDTATQVAAAVASLGTSEVAKETAQVGAKATTERSISKLVAIATAVGKSTVGIIVGVELVDALAGGDGAQLTNLLQQLKLPLNAIQLIGGSFTQLTKLLKVLDIFEWLGKGEALSIAAYFLFVFMGFVIAIFAMFTDEPHGSPLTTMLGFVVLLLGAGAYVALDSAPAFLLEYLDISLDVAMLAAVAEFSAGIIEILDNYT